MVNDLRIITIISDVYGTCKLGKLNSTLFPINQGWKALKAPTGSYKCTQTHEHTFL